MSPALSGRPYVNLTLQEESLNGDSTWRCRWAEVAWNQAGFHQEMSSIDLVTGEAEGMMTELANELRLRNPFLAGLVLLNGIACHSAEDVLAEAGRVLGSA